LQEALTKLTPQQASMMRSFLDNKVTSDNTATLIQDALQQGAGKAPFAASARIHPTAVQQPFQSYNRFNEQSKPPPRDWTNMRHQANTSQQAGPGFTNTCHQANTSQQSGPGFEESLKDHLRDLALLEQGRILMVRKVNRLGMDSPALLKDYFARFGDVARVMIAHTRCKAKGQEKARVRPAPVGFVIMSNSEQANAALAQGEEQSVNGVSIGVYSFQSHAIGE
jgi:hypothetical protein